MYKQFINDTYDVDLHERYILRGCYIQSSNMSVDIMLVDVKYTSSSLACTHIPCSRAVPSLTSTPFPSMGTSRFLSPLRLSPSQTVQQGSPLARSISQRLVLSCSKSARLRQHIAFTKKPKIAVFIARISTHLARTLAIAVALALKLAIAIVNNAMHMNKTDLSPPWSL